MAEFPLMIQRGMGGINTDIVQFVEANIAKLKEQVHEVGAILLRGWTVTDESVFLQVATQFGSILPDIACSAGPRIEVAPGVHTANEAPPYESIPFHHEMAQCHTPPKFVLFYCQIPPKEGGSTPIIHSWKLVEELDNKFPEIAAKLRGKQIRYVREFPFETDMQSPLGKSWRATLKVETREEAEQELVRQGTQWEWLPNQKLRTIGPKVPMILKKNGKEVLFTAAETAFLREVREGRPEKSFIYGDGSSLDSRTKDALVYLSEFAFEHSVHLPWQESDILVLNNDTVMHARDPFVPPRKILVSLISKDCEYLY
jgi:alpha-ketoglutarate-dependent taurine dioxygenase